MDLDRLTKAQVRPELFTEHDGIIANDIIGSLQDALHRTIVLLQLHDFQVRVILGKLRQILHGSATPGVNSLIVVPHHGKHIALTRQRAHQPILTEVSVLILVHQQILHPTLPALAHFLIVFHQLRRQADQIIKVHRLIGNQGGGVVTVNTSRLDLAGRVCGTLRIVRPHQGVFP